MGRIGVDLLHGVFRVSQGVEVVVDCGGKVWRTRSYQERASPSLDASLASWRPQ